jgi:hypothetical protein
MLGLLILLWSACADTGTAIVEVNVYGESFVEDHLDTDDDWTVTFDTFLVRIDALTLGGQEFVSTRTFDLTEPSEGRGQMVASLAVPSGSYSDFQFILHIESVSGTATNNTATKTFEWVLEQRTEYGTCETNVVATAERPQTTEITVHADHLFYDSLVSEEPAVLFQALADADTDQDTVITQAELAATGLGAYDPGSTEAAQNMWEWLLAQGQTVAHINGEGHCALVP